MMPYFINQYSILLLFLFISQIFANCNSITNCYNKQVNDITSDISSSFSSKSLQMHKEKNKLIKNTKLMKDNSKVMNIISSQSCSIKTKTCKKNQKNIFATIDSKTKKKVLNYYGLMVAGAIARSVSATAVHPLMVIKTMLQTKEGKMPSFTWKALSRGAGSQLIMNIPHGALNFAVTEVS